MLRQSVGTKPSFPHATCTLALASDQRVQLACCGTCLGFPGGSHARTGGWEVEEGCTTTSSLMLTGPASLCVAPMKLYSSDVTPDSCSWTWDTVSVGAGPGTPVMLAANPGSCLHGRLVQARGSLNLKFENLLRYLCKHACCAGQQNLSSRDLTENCKIACDGGEFDPSPHHPSFRQDTKLPPTLRPVLAAHVACQSVC